ncbi:hypothetical protein [Flavobacterium piscisymbiosum]|uniref:GIY-YIG domain-containing protein n=1 Tax=Flavobacterium piscisymbiosum TaxID=2893753 RepID=A0ABS8MGD6_9FLAO|nr:hypothetical protein [Flavobacterium sp. F-30]MCC9063755.1 hypothetical protein [Flavobacterium sp. F-30]
MNYLITFRDNKTTEQFVDEINRIEGIALKDLKVRDLLYYNGEPIRSGIGVYIFKSKDKCYYVGNCVARCFAERIPAHFDLRKVGWFNTLLKTIIKNEFADKEITDDSLHIAAKFAFDNINLVLVNFEYHKHYINQKIKINNLERDLGKALSSYNKNFRKNQSLQIENDLL